ncbi:hypothetical protein RRG08_019187 [Elysia crispata]|uniref:Uncharacterized protein n=1 Tax=Elysia crispata TaxID=231223 RepID=A0AAE0ZWG4_9GAST|nr:hypothetical protein RRG08_019187 [Elysia crispata]
MGCWYGSKAILLHNLPYLHDPPTVESTMELCYPALLDSHLSYPAATRACPSHSIPRNGPSYDSIQHCTALSVTQCPSHRTHLRS